MSSKTVELEYVEEIEEASKKLKDTFIQAYINLHGNFQGITRVSAGEIGNIFKDLIKEPSRCYFHRLNLRRNGEWDELLIILCGNTVVASHGYIKEKEVSGVTALEELAKNVNSEVYTHGIIETIEIPPRLIEEKLGVSIKQVVKEAKPEEKVEEKPRLKAEEKPPELEEVVEKTATPETIATIPLETSITRTESLPEKPATEEEKKIPPTLPPFVKPEVKHEEPTTITRKPIVLEEAIQLDKPILEFSDRLTSILSEKNINLSDAIIQGDPDKLEVEVTVTKLGWGRKREKMLKIAENIANILSSILAKNKAPQKELIVTVKHGFNAVRISKKLST